MSEPFYLPDDILVQVDQMRARERARSQAQQDEILYGAIGAPYYGQPEPAPEPDSYRAGLARRGVGVSRGTAEAWGGTMARPGMPMSYGTWGAGEPDLMAPPEDPLASELGTQGGGAMALLDWGRNVRGAALAGLSGRNPIMGYMDPSQESGRNTFFNRMMPDTDLTFRDFGAGARGTPLAGIERFLPDRSTGISPRDITGMATEFAVDPSTWAPTPVLDDALRFAGRGLSGLSRLGDVPALRAAAPEAFQVGHMVDSDLIRQGGISPLMTMGSPSGQTRTFETMTGAEMGVPTPKSRYETLPPEEPRSLWGSPEPMRGAQPELATAGGAGELTDALLREQGIPRLERLAILRKQAGNPRPGDEELVMTGLSRVMREAQKPEEAAARRANDEFMDSMGHQSSERARQMEQTRREFAAQQKTAPLRVPLEKQDFRAATLTALDLERLAGEIAVDETNAGAKGSLEQFWPRAAKIIADGGIPGNKVLTFLEEAEQRVSDMLLSHQTVTPAYLKDQRYKELLGFAREKVEGFAAKAGPQRGAADTSGIPMFRADTPGVSREAISGLGGAPATPPGFEQGIPPTPKTGGVGGDAGGGLPPTAEPPYKYEPPLPHLGAGQRFAGAVGGATAGYETGDTPEERIRNVFIGAAVGAAGVGAAQRIASYRGAIKPGLNSRLTRLARGYDASRKALPAVVSPSEMDDLGRLIRRAATDYPTSLNAQTALTKLTSGLEMGPNDWKALTAVFGQQVKRWEIEATLRGTPLPTKGEAAWELTKDIINVPRTLMASWDASAPFRQGIMLAPGHPVAFTRNVHTMFRAMFSEQYAQDMYRALLERPNAQLYSDSGLYIAPLNGKLAEREEQFMSRMAEFVPGVRASERGYVTFLNQLRADVFDDTVRNWKGLPRDAKDFHDLGQYINAFTGRGRLPDKLSDLTPVLNAAFFSPRFFVSRIQANSMAFTASPAVRSLVIKDLLKFYGSGMAALGVVAASGVADVELNPTSADFGKIRIGDYRYDFWGGQQQIARVIAQVVSGQRKSSITGETSDANWGPVVANFIRGKLAPIPATVIDFATGESVQGDEVTVSRETFQQQAAERLVPIFIQDLSEAVAEDGLTGGLMIGPAFFGMGVQHYGGTPMDKVVPGGDFYALDRSVQEDYKVKFPDLWEDTVQSGSERFRNAEALKKEYRAYQEQDDAELARSPAFASEWVDNMRDRQIELAGQMKMLYADRPPSKSRNMADEYYNRLNEWRQPNGTPDWDRIEAWRASLSDRENEYIDTNTGLGSTDQVKDYRKTTKGLRQLDFYGQTKEMPWAIVLEAAGHEAVEYGDWRTDLVDKTTKIYTNMGYPPGSAADKAATVVDNHPLSKAYAKFRRAAEFKFAFDNPELMDKAGFYGLTSLSNAEINAIRAQLGSR